ncbi:DUF58 domain-containing protein [Micromonospora sp. WMMD723]|uniref:DUF58 domain-containing protein n=1 Tax=unclassified Micromonospora TaxID=2617518 RepID=UPI003B935810
MRVLTGSGWAVLLGAVALTVAGLALGYPTLTGVGVAGAVALACALAAILIRPRISVTRTITPHRVTVGEPALIRLDVHNLNRFLAPRFDAVEQFDAAPLRVRVAPLAGRQRRALHLPVPTARRGLVRLGPVVVERYDLLGLARRAQPISGQAWLWIRPRVHPVPAVPRGVVLDFEGRLTDQSARGSTAFAALREYQPGDDPRHIHWRSSARRGTLLVREHVDTTEPTTTVLLDTRGNVLTPAGFEVAVEVAASVAAASTRGGHEVSLVAVGEDRQAVREAGGYDVLDRLAALKRSRPDGNDVLVRLAERARPGGTLVVVSGAEQGLVARLAPLRRRFSQVVVVQLDADRADPGDAGPDRAGTAGGDGPTPVPTVTRRAGLAVVRATHVDGAIRAWSRVVGGGTAC